MAQTNFTPISLYYSTTAAAVPTAGNLVAGELAINTADGKLFYKDSSNVVQVIGTKGGVGSSTNTQVLYNSSGLVVGDADFTFNGTTVTMANDASISGLTVGKGAGAIATNTAVGASALNANSTGIRTTAIGFQALINNTASENTAIGARAMLTNTSGANNTAVGRDALYSNTTGSENCSIGLNSLIRNTTGSNNTAIGRDTLQENTTANNNTAVGYQAAYASTTADQITAVGGSALRFNTGSGNTAVGEGSLYSNTSGPSNTAVGQGASLSNTTGQENASVGRGALYSNTTGSYNSALGRSALFSNTIASFNTAVGYQAGFSNTTALGNTFVGYLAGRAATTSGSNSCFGAYAGQSATGVNCTYIGQYAAGVQTSGDGNTYVGSDTGSVITTGAKNTILGRFSGNQGGLDIRTANNYIVLSDGDGNPRSFCNGTQWYFGNQTAIEYFPVTSSVSGRNAVTIDRNSGYIGVTSSDASPMYINRNTSDGDLVRFYESGTQEGSISVSGSTVSYNGGHLARWSQLPDNSKDDTILKGTVLTNLDDMCVWTKDGTVLANEQLNKMKVSDVEGDTNVAGVFVNWTKDEDCNSDDMNIAMTGDMIIRIADGVVVQKGDLLMSAGDGTAKPQGDDIVRSKTVAKVTSNHVTCTYADGSYCVPCVLMAC
jgi:hypothetical protein